MSQPADPVRNGSRPDRSRSRFFCNTPRKLSLTCICIAFAALVIGGGFAEISSNGSPTSLETALIRWIILGSLVLALVAYLVGSRQLERRDQQD